MAHFYLSAAHKSSGKTTLAIGIAAALTGRGLAVQTLKKGPDYIDPMWLKRASGRTCYNLDFNTQSHDEIRATFARSLPGADIGLVEGNKGLYDGLDIEGSDSNAAMARLLQAPVVLVINAEGITRGVAPLVVGYRAFEPDLDIAGVILNSLASGRQESKMRAVLERYTDVPVIGAVGRDRGLVVSERHLGLTTPAETGERDDRISRIAAAAEAGIDLDRILAIAARAPLPEIPAPSDKAAARDIRIGVALDTAFGFYYADDLEALEAAGAELVFFDTLADTVLPAVDGLFIGGGFPETQMAALEANGAMRAAIGNAIAAGLPVYAECGGLMYLTRAIHWNGRRHEMVGAIAADTVMNEKPQGRGLVRLSTTDGHPWNAGAVAAHEFHYAGLVDVAEGTRFGYRVRRGHGVDGANDGILVNNCVANFSHLRSTAANPWAPRFAAFVRATKAGKGA
ncbi:MAG: cobyrinate a,c-diamide synthase [Hyphomicrobiales bacterium]